MRNRRTVMGPEWPRGAWHARLMEEAEGEESGGKEPG